MLVRHFFVEKIAHSSYLLVGKKTCAVIDPERDVEIYLDAARSLGVQITHVLQTHLHADFVSGHVDLMERTGATVYAPRLAACDFDHVPLSEGDSIEIEHVRLDVLETPGHTPEHVCYVATDASRVKRPACVFTGDTLFVGDVGRPDLFPGRSEELAGMLHASLHDKLMKLPEYCEVLPAHGAGSLCGRSMAAKWTSTIGYEKRSNPALRMRSRARFIESLTRDMPPAPDHFARCSELNRKGPRVASSLDNPVRLGPAEFRESSASRGAAVLDVRGYDAFGGQHVPNAMSLPLAGNFPTFAGWVLPENARLFLVADDRNQAQEAVLWLRRVGLDRTLGYLEGGMAAWSRAGYPVSHVGILSAEEVNAEAHSEAGVTILDVRAALEFEQAHIDGSINIPAPDLRSRYVELDPEAPTIIICSSGNRSSTAAGILERKGFGRLMNAAGGYTGYAAAGLGGSCPMCSLPHGPRLVHREGSE